MSTALATRNAGEELPSQHIAHAINNALEGLKAVRTFVAAEFKEGVDFGKIPGCGDKPSLLLPGAQKATMYFNAYPSYRTKTIDLGNGHAEFQVRTLLISRATREQIGEGIGSASTMEKKFRRSGGAPMKKCPQCGKAAILKSKDKPEFFCWRRKDGCGATFGMNHPAMKETTAEGEVDAPYEIRNTVLKIAKKRSLVDAAITVGSLTELFTQDIEDIYHADEVKEAARPYDGEVVDVEAEPAPSASVTPRGSGMYTKEHAKATSDFLHWLGKKCDVTNQQWHAAWLDRLQAFIEDGHSVPEKIEDVINKFQAKNHLYNWAFDSKLLPDSLYSSEVKTRQTEAIVARVFVENKAALVAEMKDYVSRQRKLKEDAIYRAVPDLAPVDHFKDEEDDDDLATVAAGPSDDTFEEGRE